LLHFHFLLLSGAQRAGVVGLSPQALNRRGDRFLVSGERLPDCAIIVDVLSHHVEHLRKVHQRNECRIESLLFCSIGERRARQAGIRLQPGVDIQDLLGVR
jgi:hypothetical protein